MHSMGFVTKRLALVRGSNPPFEATGGVEPTPRWMTWRFAAPWQAGLIQTCSSWQREDGRCRNWPPWLGAERRHLESILVAARRRKESFSQDVAGLKELVGQCDKRSANVHRADAGRGSQDLLEAHLEHQREKPRKVLEGLEAHEVVERVRLVGAAKIFKWPTRLGK